MSESNNDQKIIERISSTQMLRLKKKFIISTLLSLALILVFWVCGEAIADIIINSGVEWLRVTTIGSMVVAIGAIVTIIFVDLMTDRHIDSYITLLEKKLKKDN